jgi:hypothetical protein
MPRRFHYGPLLSLAILAGIGVAMWHYWPRPPLPAPVSATTAGAPVPAPAPPPASVDGPVPEEFPVTAIDVEPVVEADPLPPLDDSDALFLDALSAVDPGLGDWLVAEFVVPRLVATIDNLPNARVTRQIYAGRPAPGALVVAEADGRLWLDAANSARYDAGLALFERLDLRRAVAVYVHWYPLFQRAYRDLGGPEREFNDRLVEVVDHLIAAPEATGPIQLQRQANGGPRLEFADPVLERASVGHKAMWRLGPDHAARAKARLRELRALLAGQRPAA